MRNVPASKQRSRRRSGSCRQTRNVVAQLNAACPAGLGGHGRHHVAHADLDHHSRMRDDCARSLIPPSNLLGIPAEADQSDVVKL